MRLLSSVNDYSLVFLLSQETAWGSTTKTYNLKLSVCHIPKVSQQLLSWEKLAFVYLYINLPSLAFVYLQPWARKTFLHGVGKRPKLLFHYYCMVFSLQIRVRASQLIGKHWKSRLGVHFLLSLLGRNKTQFLLVRHFQFTANYKIVCLYH